MLAKLPEELAPPTVLVKISNMSDSVMLEFPNIAKSKRKNAGMYSPIQKK